MWLHQIMHLTSQDMIHLWSQGYNTYNVFSSHGLSILHLTALKIVLYGTG